MIKRHTKKLIVVSIVMVLVLATALPAMGAPEKVRVFVEFAPGAKGQVQQALNKEGAEFHYTFDDLNSFVISVPEQALKGLAKNPNVVEIEEDAPRYPIKSTAAEVAVEAAATYSDVTGYDGAEAMPWGVQAVQAPQVWDGATSSKGANVTVCIIDTGYYQDHEDLPDSIGGTAQLDAPYTTDGYGHGSHVGGTIAGIDNTVGVIGVSPDVSLYIIKYFGNDGAATFASDLIAAASDCAANGADIISMSLGGTRATNRESRAFSTHYSNGILSIAAAGNDGNTAYSYPASYDSVVSVAALDSDLAIADFSQQNDQVEIAAPGVAVLSTLPYTESSSMTVDPVIYQTNRVEHSGIGSVSGELVDGGLCATPGSWAGMVVLCQRGDYSFAEKVFAVENGGGVAAIIYNNEPGNFFGTMDTESSDLIGLSISMEDGEYLVNNKLGATASVESEYTWPTSGYQAWNGTSMATPHVSAVAALLWSAFPNATNVEIRDAMNATAMELGDPGRDVAFGYGLVQAAAAIAQMGGGTVNNPPSVAITSPADGSTYDSGALVSFAGSASDTEDGNLSADITWTSSINGTIGTGSSISYMLADGTHTITASVEDSGGLTDTDSITVTVESGIVNTAPSVTITAPANGSTYFYGDSVNFAGSASDADDGDLSSAITWTSSIGGLIGSGGSFSISDLAVGTHTITASVTDSGGLTDSDTITVTINPVSGGDELVVDVATDAASYSDRETVTITVHVSDDLGADVAAASVSLQITTPKNKTVSYSGLTDADGSVIFTYTALVRRNGSGTYLVEAIATKAGYTDGTGSTTFIAQ